MNVISNYFGKQLRICLGIINERKEMNTLFNVKYTPYHRLIKLAGTEVLL